MGYIALILKVIIIKKKAVKTKCSEKMIPADNVRMCGRPDAMPAVCPNMRSEGHCQTRTRDRRFCRLFE